MPHIIQDVQLQKLMNHALDICATSRHEFLTPEHILLALCHDERFTATLAVHDQDTRSLPDELGEKLASMEKVPDDMDYYPQSSQLTDELMLMAYNQMESSIAEAVTIPHVVQSLLQLKESWAAYLLNKHLSAINNTPDYCKSEPASFMSDIIIAFDEENSRNIDDIEDFDDIFRQPMSGNWRQLVTCLNDIVHTKNPLIGRQQELERTIQVLCRCDKNNPLHVGEPGVGKTALVYGLADRINSGDVPDRLKGARIYLMDMGTLIAGTQYRGDFERRIKMIVEGVMKESDNNIIYIDEIHNLVGAGETGNGSLDASNMLKPYLEGGELRFIGSTTYDEYNRYFARAKGIVRRFQQIDIGEPSQEETIHILQQLKPRYEQFHGVSYDDKAITAAVQASAKYINDRFLPDKAIDLIDEAGAQIEVNRQEEGSNTVTQALIYDILAKTCKVDTLAMKEDQDASHLETLEQRIKARIFGQDEAVSQVVEAVQMAKAGLTDDDKPLSSLLFVGPTGVGKTEVARVLAQELGIALQRFDMSEYTEKHAVAKLIGSPAGYVGYEDGGLLTDAIRKTPHCVLLLDEIEKAHQDIYNILLQVMDYARLTDNKGRKADFRNVVVIMTSNAGAQYASQASIGFGGRVERGEAMLQQVKKTFKPEFINRLNATVVFHDMDRDMATRILQKKLAELQQKLEGRKVELTLSDDAFQQLLDEGITHEYGAREMDRVIARRLKPLLMHEILFGSLRQGGKAVVDKDFKLKTT